MKRYLYECDGGSLLIGNADFACCYPNNYGDGCHTVTILERPNEIHIDRNDYDFVGSICGLFNVYDYDCLSAEDRTLGRGVLCEVAGRYGIYAKKRNGDMLIEYWDDRGC